MNLDLQISIVPPAIGIFNLKDDTNDSNGSFREFDNTDIINAAIESISYLHRIGLIE